MSPPGHVSVVCRSRPGHVPVTSRSRLGHVPVTSRSCAGHVSVTSRSRPGRVPVASSGRRAVHQQCFSPEATTSGARRGCGCVVVDRLRPVLAVVDDCAEAGTEAEGCRDLLDLDHHMAQQRGVALLHVLQHVDRLLRDEQNVDGGLRAHVVEGEAQVVLVHDLRGYLLSNDLPEDRVAAWRGGLRLCDLAAHR
eukprot:CAMPEP_0119353708 /NCGR_PEP_ID=MMETSP1334-20130426/2816_1 /TAXON_ID=127549 /ORGANISM="Calcidiscus leptoporus, Strain RCC1130" /LENGTH=193 /DNA_ID=CAMNT_0007367061 /DNA_START=277 /DNA_END=859 /DNA_ORIENTATION=-